MACLCMVYLSSFRTLLLTGLFISFLHNTGAFSNIILHGRTPSVYAVGVFVPQDQHMAWAVSNHLLCTAAIYPTHRFCLALQTGIY